MDHSVSSASLMSRSYATRSYGVIYMTSLISAVFWAMLSLQTFWYFASYERDRRPLKLLVVFLWVISTAQTYVVVYGAWQYLIQNFGDYTFLNQADLPFALQFAFSATATVTVQSFFVFRVCRLSGGKMWMAVAWAPLATFQMVSALIIVIKGFLASEASYIWLPIPKGLGAAYLAVSLFVDVVTAIALLQLLHRHQGQTKVRSTMRMIRRLMVLAVLNMVWTTAFAICDLALVVFMDGELFYILFDIPICSLYCNTLLANLNMRASIAEHQSAVEMNLTTFNAVTSQAVTVVLRDGPTGKMSTDESNSHVSSELAP